MKKVSKEEFDKYLQSRPAAYCSGYTTICEPPVRHYHDKTIRCGYPIGTADYFFETEVGRITLDWLGPNGEQESFCGEFWEYYVREDV